VFENRVLRKIFVPKNEEVTGGWRKLDYEKLRNLYASKNIIRVIKSGWTRHVTRMEGRNTYKTLVGKPERSRPLGRPGRRWEYNIRMDPRETGCEGVDWMHLAQVRDQWRALVNTVMNLRVLQNAGNFLTG
jgi:hypothetical protein